MRKLYTLLTYLLLPLATLRLLWKSRHNPAYRRRIAERFSLQLADTPSKPLLIHTVSVGEFLSIKPLLERIIASDPLLHLWITTTTPTGSEQVVAFQNLYPNRISHSYLPYDTPALVRRFLRHVRPQATILMETELWPNLITLAADYGSVMLINARLSARSLRGYMRFAIPFLKEALTHLAVNAQTEDDARRLRCLGVPAHQIIVTPSIKYQQTERSIDHLHELQKWPPREQIWLAASTHDGEDAKVLDALQKLSITRPESYLIIAPRHPERRGQIADLIRQSGYVPRLRSEEEWFRNTQDIVILDTLGELADFYQLVNTAFIGGSLIDHGGHNPLEAVHAGCSVCFGPSMYNFTEIENVLLGEPFARQVANSDALASCVTLLLNEHAALQQSITVFNRQHQHILDAHYAFIKMHMQPPNTK